MTTTDRFKIPFTRGLPTAIRAIDAILARMANHRHDGSTGSAAPSVDPPTVEVLDTGGEMIGGQVLYYAITNVDDAGIETLLSAPVAAVLPEPITNPPAPSLRSSPTGGFLKPGVYTYRVSAFVGDDDTQETLPSPAQEILVPAGSVTNTITITFPELPDGAAGWNVYRLSPDGVTIGHLNIVDGAEPEYVDDGNLFEICDRIPKTVNATVQSCSVVITHPDPSVEGPWRIYRTLAPDEWADSLLHHVAEETTEGSGIITTTFTDTGESTYAIAPPPDSLALIGNPPPIDIDADTYGLLPADRIDGLTGEDTIAAAGWGEAVFDAGGRAYLVRPGHWLINDAVEVDLALLDPETPPGFGIAGHTVPDLFYNGNPVTVTWDDGIGPGALDGAAYEAAFVPNTANATPEPTNVEGATHPNDVGVFASDPVTTLDAASDLDPFGGVALIPEAPLSPTDTTAAQGGWFPIGDAPFADAILVGAVITNVDVAGTTDADVYAALASGDQRAPIFAGSATASETDWTTDRYLALAQWQGEDDPTDITLQLAAPFDPVATGTPIAVALYITGTGATSVPDSVTATEVSWLWLDPTDWRGRVVAVRTVPEEEPPGLPDPATGFPGHYVVITGADDEEPGDGYGLAAPPEPPTAVAMTRRTVEWTYPGQLEPGAKIGSFVWRVPHDQIKLQSAIALLGMSATTTRSVSSQDLRFELKSSTDEGTTWTNLTFSPKIVIPNADHTSNVRGLSTVLQQDDLLRIDSLDGSHIGAEVTEDLDLLIQVTYWTYDDPDNAPDLSDFGV
jgi:hypothetical protein